MTRSDRFAFRHLSLSLKKFRIGLVTTEVQWSELQRDPKGVAALADQGDVRVRRRDGVPLLLLREDSVSSAAEGALAAARALRNALAHLSAAGAVDTLARSSRGQTCCPSQIGDASRSNSSGRSRPPPSWASGQSWRRSSSSGRPPPRFMRIRLSWRSLAGRSTATSGPSPRPAGPDLCRRSEATASPPSAPPVRRPGPPTPAARATGAPHDRRTAARAVAVRGHSSGTDLVPPRTTSAASCGSSQPAPDIRRPPSRRPESAADSPAEPPVVHDAASGQLPLASWLTR